MKLLAASLLFALTLVGCESRSAAERRVDKNPALFGQLDDGEKELVLSGEVSEGMSRDAVFLAWGRPDMVRSSSRDGKGRERWGYFDSAPVQTSVGFGVGSYGPSPFYADFGMHPRFGYGVGPGWGYGTEVDFLPYLEKSAEFVDGRVVAWERLR